MTLRNVAQKPAVIVLRFVFRAALHKDRGDLLDTDVNVLTKHETLMISGKMDPVIDPDLVVNKWKLRRMSPTDHLCQLYSQSRTAETLTKPTSLSLNQME